MPRTPQDLLRVVRRLPASVPIADAIKHRHAHKEHWTGWLAEYDGPGYYGRANHNRDARYVYNHINAPAMLIWLAEASGVDTALVREAVKATRDLPYARQAAAVRRVIPWHVVEPMLWKAKRQRC